MEDFDTYESVDQLQGENTMISSENIGVAPTSMVLNQAYMMNDLVKTLPSSECHQLQRNSGNIKEKSATNADNGQAGLNKEYDDIRAAMKKMKMSLIITVSVNMAILLLVNAVTIGLSAHTAGHSTTAGKTSSDIQSIQTQILNFQTQFYCGPGQWDRVAHLNMSDPTQQCPSAWREYSTNGVRACGRPSTTGESCPATFYSTTNQYTKVCGRVIGYQYGTPDAFGPSGNINQNYLDGVSITHGAPCQHIWSYAGGATENDYANRYSNCPCTSYSRVGAPSFVGNKYYCESGKPGEAKSGELHPDDKLWDGQQCEGSCCTGTKSPPWFSVQLPAPTNDVIEVRICGDESTDNEDTPVELIEIFVSR